MRGAVYSRGRTWTYRFRAPVRDGSTGEVPWVTKGGFATEKEAWKACREAMREADRGRIMKPRTEPSPRF